MKKKKSDQEIYDNLSREKKQEKPKKKEPPSKKSSITDKVENKKVNGNNEAKQNR